MEPTATEMRGGARRQWLTNLEVAGGAFIGPETVDANLACVYLKLGIRFRTGLAGRIAPPRDEGAQTSGTVDRAAEAQGL